mmetsp:Transcript_13772/g.34952  ORF Transcript_13772/g.34952 Transcript_13772/m.34952 type:complete len:447 (-) Transcript_13772:81-1421(-)
MTECEPPGGATVQHGGFLYAALDGTHPDAPFAADSDSFKGIKVPSGWEVVPWFIKKDILTKVVSQRSWGANFMHLTEFHSIATRLVPEASNPGQWHAADPPNNLPAWVNNVGCDETPDGLVTHCEVYRILIRKPVVPGAKSPPDIQYIKEQVEYYLSDKNLAFDKFFHDKISANDQGWLDIDLILSCSKMKAFGAAKRDVVQALTNSAIEVNEDCSAVRRPDNAPLPTLSRRKGKGEGRDRGKGGKGKGGKGNGGKDKGRKGKGYGRCIEKRLTRVGPYARPWWTEGDPADPEGLVHALLGALHHLFERGWEVSFGDGDDLVEPHLFCIETTPGETGQDARSLIMGRDFDPSRCRDGEGCECWHLQAVDPFEVDLEGWFDDDEEDEVQAREAVKSFMAQHGAGGGFSYLRYQRGSEYSDGFGVITKSGFAVGLEVCPIIFHPGSTS